MLIKIRNIDMSSIIAASVAMICSKGGKFLKCFLIVLLWIRTDKWCSACIDVNLIILMPPITV